MGVDKVALAPGGPVFSRLVWGVMNWGVWGSNLSPDAMAQLIESGVDRGITTFDHADIYGHYTTEATFGEALSRRPGLRQRLELVSKCGIKLVTPNRPEHQLTSYDTRKEYIVACAERSLRNLHTDYLDLLLIHRPTYLLDADEVAEAFHLLKDAGKVLYFGVSNFTPAQFALLHDRFPLVTNQVEASLVHLDPLQDGTFDQLQQLRRFPMVWGPLGSGSVFRDDPDERIQRIRRIAGQLSANHDGATLDQILLAWLLQLPVQTLPVLGTTRLDRMEAAIAALDISLDMQEWFMLLEASVGQSVP